MIRVVSRLSFGAMTFGEAGAGPMAAIHKVDQPLTRPKPIYPNWFTETTADQKLKEALGSVV